MEEEKQTEGMSKEFPPAGRTFWDGVCADLRIIPTGFTKEKRILPPGLALEASASSSKQSARSA